MKMSALPPLLVCITAAMLVGCKGTRTVSIDAMRPAEITFPSHVGKLVIVDRSKFERQAVNIIEGVLTGELPGEDRAGVQALVSAFQQQLRHSPRFEASVASEWLTGNSVTSVFPDPLPWSRVERLCSRYDAQALVSIEIYDTDFVVTNGSKLVTRTVVVDSVEREIEARQFSAEGLGNVTIGIRLYDPRERSVVDQQLLRTNDSWSAVGATVTEAAGALLAKSEAARLLSERVGVAYARKIAPMPIRITRSFTGKNRKLPALEQGSRYADVGQWDEAIGVWEAGLPHATRKQSADLTYNIAVGHEVLGDLDVAYAWAQRSYVEHGSKTGRDYVELLRRRLDAERLAMRQLR